LLLFVHIQPYSTCVILPVGGFIWKRQAAKTQSITGHW
jgi:hypothetical protein